MATYSIKANLLEAAFDKRINQLRKSVEQRLEKQYKKIKRSSNFNTPTEFVNHMTTKYQKEFDREINKITHKNKVNENINRKILMIELLNRKIGAIDVLLNQ